MRNIKLEFSYDGRNYYGLQKQKNCVTIQGEIERALTELFGKEINLIIAGRTDKGVSSLKMVGNFYVESNIEADKICYALNVKLPNDIRILSSCEVDFNFHSRYDAKQKTYKYSLYENNFSLPLFPFETLFKAKLNYSNMKRAIKYLVGKHDFSSFVTKSKKIDDKVRTIYKVKLVRKVIQGINHYYFYFTGNGFLYNQVRTMVGTLILAGINKIKPKDIKKIIKNKNRSYAGSVMPANGLVLTDIKY